jgi:hypothetical protein
MKDLTYITFPLSYIFQVINVLNPIITSIHQSQSRLLKQHKNTIKISFKTFYSYL